MPSINVHLVSFDSWGSYLTYTQQPVPYGVDNATDTPEREGSFYSDFYRTPSYAAAQKLAFEGWVDAAASARKLSNALVRQIGSMVERDEELYDVEGYGVDISLYNQGIPECWMRNEQRYDQAPGPIVKIVFNASASCGVSSDTMVAKGAAIAGLIECIELSGRSVELWVLPWCASDTLPDRHRYSDARVFCCRVKVKDAGQPLDMSRVMFALAHPSSVRRLGFRTIELAPAPYNRFGGKGYPTDIPEGKERGDLYVPKSFYGEPQWTNEDATRQWVIEQLRKQNVQVNDATTEVK